MLKGRNHKSGYVTSSNCTLDSLSTFIVNNKQQMKQLTKNKKRMTNIYHMHIIQNNKNTEKDKQKNTLAESSTSAAKICK